MIIKIQKLVVAITILFFSMLLHAQNKETILFSGFDWHQKVASKPTGPGGNIFGVHHKNVTIDRDGCLNLRVVNQNACAEVFSELFFKEGTFETVIETNINKFAPELVFRNNFV